jgi:heptosyltransferase-2/heptosyltransferase-3
LGFVGVPVSDLPKSRLAVTLPAAESLEKKLYRETQTSLSDLGPMALFHPAAAFDTKEWAVENFARVAEYLAGKGISVIAVAAKDEQRVLEDLRVRAKVPVKTFSDLTLPEITALASMAELFVGNDSGIAHIAAAVGRPSVVIFGSSNRDHWRPWTDAPNEIVFEEFNCQPCPGYECKEFGEPRCIQSVPVRSVEAAIERVLARKKGRP